MPKIIALIEDNTSFEQAILNFFSNKPGYKCVMPGDSGSLLVDGIKKHNTDLILIGSQSPLSYLSDIKQRAQLKIPVIVILRNNDKLSPQAILDAGANVVLKESQTYADLMREIIKLLNN